MKIRKLSIQNFRLLKNCTIDLEDQLSLIIGKNNTGKTSILSVLNKFLSPSERHKFRFEDFNIELRKEIAGLILSDQIVPIDEFVDLGIKLKLFIEYNEADDLSNVSKVMMDLDPENTTIVLGFEYTLGYDEYLDAKRGFKDFVQHESVKQKKAESERKEYKPKGILEFLQKHYETYFSIVKKSFEYDKDSKLPNELNFINLDDESINLKDIISFKFISAKREVTNKDYDKTLSSQTSRIYKGTEANDEQSQAVEDFKDQLTEADGNLTKIYETLFNKIVEKVKLFGGVKINESAIEIISTLQHRELLEGNTTVVYRHEEHQLPEHYNGLGYMNLISMIFEIEILVQEFKREKEKRPADINLLFIEEPEAHTHPQMQYVFIQNIKELLKEGVVREGVGARPLQYIISTHSSHIVANSDFNDIKYLKKDTPNSVDAKNLKDLEKEYVENGQTENFRFLKQYLTLNRAELFFADKAIFIEGETERILLPAMMKKIDIEFPENPLLAQNISIVEVGNYANVFERFINFVGIKSLIVTDLDSVKRDFVRNSDGTIKKTGKGKDKKADYSCIVSEGERTSNPTLNFFFSGVAFHDLRVLDFERKRFKKESNWIADRSGFLQIVFQTEENTYQARSFEDAFFNLIDNVNFIKNNRSKFKGLKNVTQFYDTSKTPYDRAENCIESKGTFAIDILLLSANSNFSNWHIPSYIKEGLLWLKQD